jgi:cell wall-associated NlpC family hydrolase
VAWALGEVGKPYLWGASGPDAYDCSGLTSQAWLRGGVSLPRTSRDQYRRVAKIAYSDLRPGDLVFYGTDPDDAASIYHVAMYVGGGRVVEAPRAGVPVREAQLRLSSSMTWAGRP